MNGFDINVSVSALTVFVQGLLSFFSPCVLPLIPLYMAYLSGGSLSHKKIDGEEGPQEETTFSRGRAAVNTLFFVLGISAAFFILGLGFSAFGLFMRAHQALIARIGGVIVILFGLYQLGVFGQIGFLSSEKRLPLSLQKIGMSPLTALLMGFIFSFSWTPCVGPVLSSVLIMAAGASSRAAGFLLIGVYTLGFVLPFLAAGLFTVQVLSFFKKHRNVVRYTTIVGGVLLILMGILMITGTMNKVSSYLSAISTPTETSSTTIEESAAESVPETSSAAPEEEESSEERTVPAPEFTLTDQYGNTHSLADYRGKVVFLNFWATWCPPCREEMPYIEELYEEYLEEGREDVVFLSIAYPGLGQEQDIEGVTAFMEENGYTYPALMDTEAVTMRPYYITAFPTTFMILPDGSVYGYVAGSLTKEFMVQIIEQTLGAVQ